MKRQPMLNSLGESRAEALTSFAQLGRQVKGDDPASLDELRELFPELEQEFLAAWRGRYGERAEGRRSGAGDGASSVVDDDVDAFVGAAK